MITKVTVTGADESTNPEEMLEIASQFPFVEFGILLAQESDGHPRFPGRHWIRKFKDCIRNHEINCSGHLCGRWVREILVGEVPSGLDEVLKLGIFRRWQINTHAIKHTVGPGFVDVVRDMGARNETVIVQYDDVNQHILELLRENKLRNIATLFDISHGAGILPEAWPKPIKGVLCGFAGGLSPENVSRQIKKILQQTGDAPFWIDAETRLRTPKDFDDIFDLTKVVNFLEAAKPFVG